MIKKVKEHERPAFSLRFRLAVPGFSRPPPARQSGLPDGLGSRSNRFIIPGELQLLVAMPRRLKTITRMSSGGLLTGRDVGGNLAAYAQFRVRRGQRGK
jgi:hypothetical protein